MTGIERLTDFEKMKLEIKRKAKNGIDFIFSASITWFGIFFIWRFLTNSSYDKSVLTFMFGAMLLPLALVFSKIFKTNWKIKNNPLQPLGLWINFAQLIYFPILIFILIKYPDYFIMTYAIITGAHLFPYAWYYDEIGYAIIAILISVGALLVALFVAVSKIFYIPILTATSLLMLGLWLTLRHRVMIKKNAAQHSA